MKKHLIIASVIFLISTGFFSSCKEKEEQPENPFLENIIGQWKLIAQGYYDSYNNNSIVINPVKNSEHYIEFFPNGKMKRHYSFIEEIEYPYQIDEQFLYENYKDDVNAFIYKYEIDENTLTLEYFRGNILDLPNPIVINIYQQLKK